MSTEMSTSQRDSPWASGPTLFAATLMVISGVCVLFAGAGALVHDKIYTDGRDRARVSHMVFQFLAIPFYPIGLLLIILLDAAILWALAINRGNAR